jgi:uncharacterized protein (TIGR03437 family)
VVSTACTKNLVLAGRALLSLLVLAVAPHLAAAPAITLIANAASNLGFGPNGPIAQGAIFIIKGTGLGPDNITFAPAPFQTTSLGGTSVTITAGTFTTTAPLYYTSATQVAGLLPSNTPTGGAMFAVTYNGQTSNSAGHGTAENNLGIFTIDSSGSGPGILTYPDYSLVSSYKASNCGGPNTTCGAANAGDTLILWATGLGPVNGDDASGAGLGVNMPNLPLTVWVGGVQAQVQYQGRSGCCVGEDQIVFTVPNGVPTGCAVPLAIQMANFVSNTVFIPVAAGSRSCNVVDPAIAQIDPAQLSGTIALGVPEIDHFINDSGNGFQDLVQNTFLAFTVPVSLQPFAGTFLANIPIGTCTTKILSGNGGGGPPFLSNPSVLDAGSKLTIAGANGSMTATVNPGDQATLSADGTFLVPGDYTITGTGGNDVGPFSAKVTIPALPALTSPNGPTNFTVSRSKPLTVTWTPNSSPTHVEIQMASFVASNVGVRITCTAPVGAGTLTIPSYVLLALPTGNGTNFHFQPGDGPGGPATATAFSATGIALGLAQVFVDGVGFGGFQITP